MTRHRVVFVGAYAYAQRVLDAIPIRPLAIITNDIGAPMQETVWRKGVPVVNLKGGHEEADILANLKPDLVVVAGWRRLVPLVAPTVGFHSAKLPEYPGRAPVANAIYRCDPTLTNTMLWLDDGVDSGDVIDSWEFPIEGRTPEDIYAEVGETSALLLKRHFYRLLDGTAPSEPQDKTKRGALTPVEAWRWIGY